jgi:hypothetical protein
MGIQFFTVFALSIAFLSMGVTGCRDFVVVTWEKSLLFQTHSTFVEDLDRGTLPEGLRRAFEDHGRPALPTTASVSIEEKQRLWHLQANPAQTYTIKRDIDKLTVYNGALPNRNFAAFKSVTGFLFFLLSLYLMGFFLYLEERESGRIMKNVKSFVRLREFLERQQEAAETPKVE